MFSFIAYDRICKQAPFFASIHVIDLSRTTPNPFFPVQLQLSQIRHLVRLENIVNMLAAHQTLNVPQRIQNGCFPRSIVPKPQLKVTWIDPKICQTSKIVDINFGYHGLFSSFIR